MPQWTQKPQLRVQFGPELMEKLEKARARSGRTVTGEIAHRLELSFARERNRSKALKNTATILQLFLDALPHVPPAQIEAYVRKAKASLEEIASQLGEEQEEA
jgi:hypothetical protein